MDQHSLLLLSLVFILETGLRVSLPPKLILSYLFGLYGHLKITLIYPIIKSKLMFYSFSIYNGTVEV